MTRLFAILATLCTLTTPLAAQDRTAPVVVELYTSQGCSSCPPADKLLDRLAQRDDVLPLALHVDYWDYLGWKDAFADPANAVRQKGFARVGGRKMVYTPQMIVMGQEDVVGADSMALAELIAKHAATPPRAQVAALRDGATVTITAQALAAITGPVDVHLVQYTPHQEVEIRRGENAGRKLGYTNVVANWQQVGRWDGAAPLTLEVPVTSDLPAAILLQGAEYGPILAAARVR